MAVGRLITMQDARELLDKQLLGLNRVVLRDGGSVSRPEADAKAKTEYADWDAARKTECHRLADEGIAKLLAEAKALPRSSK